MSTILWERRFFTNSSKRNFLWDWIFSRGNFSWTTTQKTLKLLPGYFLFVLCDHYCGSRVRKKKFKQFEVKFAPKTNRNSARKEIKIVSSSRFSDLSAISQLWCESVRECATELNCGHFVLPENKVSKLPSLELSKLSDVFRVILGNTFLFSFLRWFIWKHR